MEHTFESTRVETAKEFLLFLDLLLLPQAIEKLNQQGYNISIETLRAALFIPSNTEKSSSSPSKKGKNGNNVLAPKGQQLIEPNVASNDTQTKKKAPYGEKKNKNNEKKQCGYIYRRGPKSGTRCERYATKDSDYCVTCKNQTKLKKKTSKDKSEEKSDPSDQDQKALEESTLHPAFNKSNDKNNDTTAVVSLEVVDWDKDRGLYLAEEFGYIITNSSDDNAVVIGKENKETNEIDPLSESEKAHAKMLGLVIMEDLSIPGTNNKTVITSLYDEDDIPEV